MKKLVYSLLIAVFTISFMFFNAEASSNNFSLSNLEGEQIELSLKDDCLIIENLPQSEHFEYFTAVFYKGSGYKSVKSATNSTTHTVKFNIPYYSDDDYQVAVFYGNDILTPFLPYTITINISSGEASFVSSPTFASNTDKFNSSPSSKDDMEYYSFYYLSKNDGDEQVRNIVKSLINGIESDYDKAFALYDWLTSNFYYNSFLNDDQGLTNASMKDLLIDKICDSRDFAALYSNLLRAAGISARTVYGIGLVNNRDTSQSTVHHYWNEVYIDDRWIIVDVAMSCSNQYIDGIKYRVPKTNNIYFDSTLEFFSYSHSIISYEAPAYYEGYKDITIQNKANATPKTLDSLGIPTSVIVKTSIGDFEVNVEWDLANANYDPNIKSEQTFSVNGSFTLPSVFAACNSLNQRISVEVTVNARYPIKVEIESLPEKLVYFVGDDIVTDGLVLKATFDNGDVEQIRRAYEVDYNLSNIGESLVAVSYKDVVTTFEVEVVSRKPNELKIEKEPDKKVYLVNENFDKNGLILLAVCDGGLSYYIDDYDVQFDFSETGNRNVVLTYEGVSVIINVQVDDITPVDIKLLKFPDKIDYYIDSQPDFSGIIAEVTFNDGSKKTVSNELSFNYDLSSLGNTLVEVMYGGVSASFEVNVIEHAEDNSNLNDSSKDYTIDESNISSNNSSNVNNNEIKEDQRSYIVEIVGISIVSILLVVMSFFALRRANEMHEISEWIKNKK